VEYLLRESVGSEQNQSKRKAMWAADREVIGVGLPKPFRDMSHHCMLQMPDMGL
jgi:hypothetical protein